MIDVNTIGGTFQLTACSENFRSSEDGTVHALPSDLVICGFERMLRRLKRRISVAVVACVIYRLERSDAKSGACGDWNRVVWNPSQRGKPRHQCVCGAVARGADRWKEKGDDGMKDGGWRLRAKSSLNQRVSATLNRTCTRKRAALCAALMICGAIAPLRRKPLADSLQSSRPPFCTCSKRQRSAKRR